MFKTIKKEIDWCGKKISLETGRVGLHADCAVLVKSGETTLLCTAVASKKPIEGADFLPLTVVYREMTAAAGKIPGGFFKREGRPSEYEVLTSRLIDRPIRPLFPKGFTYELQVICTLLSYDGETSSDVLAMIGASAALTISGVPFLGPISGIRVGMIDGEFVANPSVDDQKASELDLVIAGTKDSILMVESEAKELPEDKMLGALEFGHKNLQPICKLISDFDKEVKNPKWSFEPKVLDKKIVDYVEAEVKSGLEDAYKEKAKKVRNQKISDVKEALLEKTDFDIYSEFDVYLAFKSVQENIVRERIVKKGQRIDGRDNKAIRNIATEVSVLDRTHGSALFTRGETQALVTTTLGSVDDEQMIDSLDGVTKENFMLHYNFLPYSVGEVSPLRAPGRREIGHGKLAWRAIRPVLPVREDFPYTIRTVSEITSCNGSSSMATVCGASLSMMDAGVPIKSQVAGIAMGLIMDAKDKFVILSDILGDEDHLGDMDFKVAGTESGITALQMDIKVDGVTFKIMKEALTQAKEGRLHILKEMNKSLSESRNNVSKYAPSITKISINKNKIGALIGPGGKNIKEICEVSGAKVDIDDSGTVFIAATGQESAEKAIEMVNAIVLEPEVGKEYEGTVTKMLDFGAVVSFMGGKEGLLHISEIREERVENIHDILKEGDKVKVRVLGIDEKKGKIKLSMKDSSPAEKEAKNNQEAKKPAKKKPKPSSDHSKKEDKEKSKNVSKKKYFNF